MTDFLGKELSVGDKVVALAHGRTSSTLYFGEVEKLATKMVISKRLAVNATGVTMKQCVHIRIRLLRSMDSKVRLNPVIDDLRIKGYQANPQIRNIPVAK